MNSRNPRWKFVSWCLHVLLRHNTVFTFKHDDYPFIVSEQAVAPVYIGPSCALMFFCLFLFGNALAQLLRKFASKLARRGWKFAGKLARGGWKFASKFAPLNTRASICKQMAAQVYTQTWKGGLKVCLQTCRGRLARRGWKLGNKIVKARQTN